MLHSTACSSLASQLYFSLFPVGVKKNTAGSRDSLAQARPMMLCIYTSYISHTINS